MKSVSGPARSGWSGLFALFSVEGERPSSCAHGHHVHRVHWEEFGRQTRTTRTCPDRSPFSGRLRARPHPDLPGPDGVETGPERAEPGPSEATSQENNCAWGAP
jgi:hypothetical protein